MLYAFFILSTELSMSLNEQLHGQHLVKDVVIRALQSHYSDPEPKKVSGFCSLSDAVLM